MTDLQTFVLESAKNESTKLFVLPRWGEDRPIELTVIDSAQRNAAQKKATRPSKDGLTRDMHEFQCQICLAGIKNVPFTDVKFINSADEINTKKNADAIKQADKEYEKALKQWEKEGSNEETKPVKIVPHQRPRVLTPKDALEFTFFPGEIDAICDKILDISGFGVTLKELEDQAKN